MGTLSFMLPFEVITLLMSCAEEVKSWCEFTPSTEYLKSTLEQWAQRMNVSFECLLALGLWGDSAPMGQRDSLYLFLWNILGGSNNERFWFCAFSKNSCCDCGCEGRCTFNVVFDVLSWNLRALLLRLFPWCRHDNVAWEDSPYANDRKRAERAGETLIAGGAIIRKRGDWQWFKQLFNFKGWQAKVGTMCFCCDCLFSEIRIFGMHARWRLHPAKHVHWLRAYVLTLGQGIRLLEAMATASEQEG